MLSENWGEYGASDEEQELNDLEELSWIVYNLSEKIQDIQQKIQDIQQRRQQEETRRQMFMEFIQTYPDVKADQIPQEVWQMTLQQGYPLTAAYAIWKNKQQSTDEGGLHWR